MDKFQQAFTYCVGGPCHGLRVPFDPNMLHLTVKKRSFDPGYDIKDYKYERVKVDLFNANGALSDKLPYIHYYVPFEVNPRLYVDMRMRSFWAGVIATHIAGNLSSLSIREDLTLSPFPLTQDDKNMVLNHLEQLRTKQ